MEFADRQGRNDATHASLRNAPPWVIARVNHARRQVGLPTIGSMPDRVDDHGGPFVRWDESSPHRPRAAGNGATVGRRSTLNPFVTRVMIAVSHGQTRAGRADQPIPRTLRPDAFGSARNLNGEIGWALVGPGHEGPILAFAGDELRAHDSEIGLILEWLPDFRRDDHRAAVHAIEAGANGVSARYVTKESHRSRLPMLCELVTSARLVHVALLPDGELPGMPGSRAKVFRSARRDDPQELRRNIDAVIECARWHNARSRRAAW